jgi:hypothetical protein
LSRRVGEIEKGQAEEYNRSVHPVHLLDID